MMTDKMNINGIILRTQRHAKALRIISSAINMMSLRLIRCNPTQEYSIRFCYKNDGSTTHSDLLVQWLSNNLSYVVTKTGMYP